MAKVLYCGKDQKCPCAALTGGEMRADELFGMEFDDGFAPDPLRDPAQKGYVPIELVADPAGPNMIPLSQRDWHPSRRTGVRCVPHKIKTAVRVSPTVLRYRPAA
ncbi:hypothetical protein A2524_02465 [Candidatus Wolfebacteria bacterium RIFOXYD12_FULL_48_21]|uniref:Uncharacterized protein n=1 Tax=Candidatus Wolfebacteria bacterium RIFOXYD1_FULL_48_65 TaxID=1802561 RepID=A0A1F8DYV6_9BACT|nr:MAG: hypothetical protein A2610_01135 [Candidatus Wolfebacteria bacterium RIFOXYD1_FULL_48_65]OGM94731.1 MAG: hypothetical protein A2524_02465 [Candidatus Wolfebacteria bacterium RIFOXYD12_FULL_48_21]OGM95711.1 MAG: hypothetical protein A2532_03645 [Candidatus Wolfebacteria bacterium RIFOXYD2_FULL_48_11]